MKTMEQSRANKMENLMGLLSEIRDMVDDEATSVLFQSVT